MTRITRRTLLAAGVVTLAGGAMPGRLLAADRPRLRKAVKFHMIREGNTVAEKFALIKRVGFDGVEMNSPDNVDRAEVVAAAKRTDVTIHGVVDSTHWTVRHSDPDPAVRGQALKDLLGAIQDCKTYGGSTVLLVPGKATDDANENFDQVWERSTEQVKKALPAAREAGVKIAIENVGNNFIQTPEQMIRYVDQFGDPAIGAYFDCSNHLRHGVPSETWIRQLGKRMLKFDFKGYDLRAKKMVQIGEGSENWPEILKALAEVGYQGWATAEVKGGGEGRLREVAAAMDKVLGL